MKCICCVIILLDLIKLVFIFLPIKFDLLYKEELKFGQRCGIEMGKSFDLSVL